MWRIVLACVAACSFVSGASSNGSGSGDGSGSGSDGSSDDGRRVDGLAIDAAIDAPGACEGNATACTTAGGTCMSGTCVIACTSAGTTYTCPAGMPCEIDAGNGCSRDTLDCSAATSCVIECKATNSCSNGVQFQCGNTTPCTIYCRANNSCDNDSVSGGSGCTLECCPGANKVCNNTSLDGSCSSGSACP
jgi:hypothetical protein